MPDADMPRSAMGPGPAGAPGAAPAPAAPSGPAGAPLSAPVPREAMKARALLRMQIVLQILKHDLSVVDQGSDLEKAMLSAYKSLSTVAPAPAPGALGRTEIQAMGAAAPAVPAVTPAQQAAFRSQIASRLGAGPGGAARPVSAPPVGP